MTGPQRRYAAITPYHKEERALLERCIASVRRQSIPAEHFLVSDGFSQDWLDGLEGIRHIRLGKEHGDYGNTPRGIGALLAVSEGYDGIFFIDADNWVEANHVQACVEAAEHAFGSIDACDWVMARRLFKRFDETTLPVSDESGHVDTNCYFFFPGAFHMLSVWVTMPKYLSCLGDRFFHQAIKARNLRCAAAPVATVNYLSTYTALYRAAGETPPPGTKETVRIDLSGGIGPRSEREREIFHRLTGGLHFRAGQRPQK